jgi:hypothetical protein
MEQIPIRSNVQLSDTPSFAAINDENGRSQREDTPASTASLMHDSAALAASGRVGSATPVPAQIGFWFFVLKDALELHVARTLALIAAHPDVLARVHGELRDAGALEAQGVGKLLYLGACITETLRLWTPVPILLRRATGPFALRDDIRVENGEQLLIYAGHYHRDPRVFGARADRFSPDEAIADDTPLYVFSAHRQACAGQSLVMLMLKATLASLLGRCRFELAGQQIDAARIPCLYDHFSVALRAHPDA